MQEFQYAVKYNPGVDHHVPEDQPTPPPSPNIDKGPAFTSNIWTVMEKMLDIGQEYAPRYHHQSTGLVE